jgi:glycosyltransferase involved in cell wall biosynthesis
MNTIKLTIIITVYNQKKLLDPLLTSLLNQTDKQFFALFVDDGSVDHCARYIEDRCEGKIHYRILYQDNSGVSVARNKGIENCNTEYIQFLDGDDFLDTNCVAEINKKITENFPDFIYFGFDEVYQNHTVFRKYTDTFRFVNGANVDNFRKAFLNTKINFCIGSFVCKRKLVLDNNIVFSKRYRIGEDIEFFIKYLCVIKTYSAIKSTLHFYVKHENNSVFYNPGHRRLDAIKAIIKSMTWLERYNCPEYMHLIKVAYLPRLTVFIIKLYFFNESRFLRIVNNHTLQKYMLTGLFHRHIKIKERCYIILLLICPCFYRKVMVRYKQFKYKKQS